MTAQDPCRLEPDARDLVALEALRSRWTIGERVRVTDDAMTTVCYSDPSYADYGQDGAVAYCSLRHYGGVGFEPQVWVLLDGDPHGPGEWREEQLERAS